MEAQIDTAIKELFTKIIKENITIDAFAWLSEKAQQSSDSGNNYQLNLSFTAIPRKTGKKEVILENADKETITSLLPGFSMGHWTIDRLCRVWLLMQLEDDQKEKYVARIDQLFPQAEMNEQVALYSSLPLLSYPDEWKLRCAEGIRSNIGPVLEAIMYFNPYPAGHLDELAWNQLVMKAFFTDKDVNNITGLDSRANQSLANILFDYVEERWAAHRETNPQIWRLVGPFMDEPHFYMLERLFAEGDETEKQAAALACAETQFGKSKKLLDQHDEYRSAINSKTLSWEVVAAKK